MNDEIKKKLSITLEGMCNVMYQRIKRNQEYGALQVLDTIQDSYNGIINKFKSIDLDLTQIIVDHLNNSKILADEKQFTVLSRKLDQQINFIEGIG